MSYIGLLVLSDHHQCMAGKGKFSFSTLGDGEPCTKSTLHFQNTKIPEAKHPHRWTALITQYLQCLASPFSFLSAAILTPPSLCGTAQLRTTLCKGGAVLPATFQLSPRRRGSWLVLTMTQRRCHNAISFCCSFV